MAADAFQITIAYAHTKLLLYVGESKNEKTHARLESCILHAAPPFNQAQGAVTGKGHVEDRHIPTY